MAYIEVQHEFKIYQMGGQSNCREPGREFYD